MKAYFLSHAHSGEHRLQQARWWAGSVGRAPPVAFRPAAPGCVPATIASAFCFYQNRSSLLCDLHSADHYTGLSDNWSAGPIYCSAVTARLTAHMLGVAPQFLVALPLDTPTMIQGAARVLMMRDSATGLPG